ncbi:hypothetical protein E8E12_008810 [Didymella heteroderae]|uniref:Uncharacterized protein n=1 Tax=Didymella heteroderae TaxID=1769908 RepID=A0A9P5C2K9_9PLEO|nr:hypothetical protein E8E12_008810 [Didymella heteroderae]
MENHKRRTPLFNAATGGNSDVILILLRAGGTVARFERSVHGTGSTSPAFVDYIVAIGYLHLVQELLDLDTSQLGINREGKAAALAAAAAKIGQIPILQSLSVSDQKAFNPYRKTQPIYFAVLHGHVEAVRTMMAPTGISGNLSPAPKLLPYLVRRAAQRGHLSILKLMLESSPSVVNCQNHRGYSALHLATLNGHLQSVQYLLSCPKINTCLQGRRHRRTTENTALHLAAQSGHTSIIQALLDHGGIGVAQKGRNEETALLAAFWGNHLDAVRILLTSGACSLELQETCLDTTSINTVAQSLLRTGLLKYTDTSGFSRYDYSYGKSLLYLAAESGDVELARYFLLHENFDPVHFTRKVDISNSSWNTETAQQAAQRKGHQEVAELIEAHRAKHASNTLPNPPPSWQPLSIHQKHSNESSEQGPGVFDHSLQPDFGFDFDMGAEGFDFDFDEFLHDEQHVTTGIQQSWMDTVMTA